MAGELLLINPRKRHRKSSKRRARRHNPVRAIRRHRRRRHHISARRHHNPIRRARHHYRRRRRNPLSLSGMRGGLTSSVTGALMGAGGAILNDALLTYVPLPLMLKTGPMAILTKALGAFGVGWLSSFAIGKHRGAQLTEGALIVLAYQVVKPMVSTVLPLAGNEIEGLGYYSPGMILQDSLSPLPDLNTGTPLQAYLSGIGETNDPTYAEATSYDPTINAYIP